MSKNVLALGPFIGSFEQEILTFRPYMRWIELNTDTKHVFYSSHFNRKFLYPQVSNRRYKPVYKQLTRQEIHQSGYSHKDVDQHDFMGIVRKYKDTITLQMNCIKKNIDQQSLPYVKYISPISIYHKVFEPIKVPISKRRGYVVFIPDISMTEDDALLIFDYLNSSCKFAVVGDMKCHLPESNEILQDIDYIQTGYQKTITAITNAKAVITPCSHWTVIANLQNVPVLSWGENVGQYRTDGIYNFNNNKAKIIYHNNNGNIRNLLKQIDKYLQEID